MQQQKPITSDPDLISEIIPGLLYLGDYRAAENLSLLRKLKIRQVLNCTKTLPNYHEHAKTYKLQYHRLPINDSLLKKDFDLMAEYLKFAVEVIHLATTVKKEPILVHCVQGAQRSCAAVVAYLITYKHMEPNNAVSFLCRKRPIAFHNGRHINFKTSLKKYMTKANINIKPIVGSGNTNGKLRLV